jgi:hypothetical protein
MREWVEKFKTGEYLHEWRGFSPFWLGCYYGDGVVLGGEKEFSHCYDFFSGIGDVDWWITAEIDKLTEEQKERMYSLLVRNKSVDDMLSDKIDFFSDMANKLDIGTEYFYRLGNKLRKELVESDNPIELYKKFLIDEAILNKLSFDTKTRNNLIKNDIIDEVLINETKSNKPIVYIDGSIAKVVKITKNQYSVLKKNGFGFDNIPMKEDLETLLNMEI